MKDFHLIDQPCVKDCPNRTTTCKFDGTCDEYQKFNDKMNEIRSERRKNALRNEMLNEHREKAKKRFNRHSKVGES